MDQLEARLAHYKDTGAQLHWFRKARNQAYLICISVTTAAVLVTSDEGVVHGLLIQLLTHLLGGGAALTPDMIARTVPYRVIYAFVLACVVFTLVTLLHRAEYVYFLRRYQIRSESKLRELGAATDPDDVVYTRDGTFLVDNSSLALRATSPIFFILLLVPCGYLLVNGILARWMKRWEVFKITDNPLQEPTMWITARLDDLVDLAAALAIIGLLVAYAWRWFRRTPNH